MEGTIIRHLKVNTGTAQAERLSSYALQAYHGQKVGQLLYDQAMQLTAQAKADYVWLGVWENNPRAIRFYEKNGFVAFDKHVFVLGDDAQTDILMKRSLTNSSNS